MMKKIYSLILMGILTMNFFFAYAQTTLCIGQNIIVSTYSFNSDGDYEQFYVIVDESGQILEVNNSGVFSGFTVGNYLVYAVNTNQQAVKDEMLDLGLWSDVVNMTASYCMDVLTPQSFVIIDVVTPIFTVQDTICQGDILPSLPLISENNIQGSWSPAINNMTTTTYSFTPNSDQCAASTNLKIVVKEYINPVFPTVASFCHGDAVPNLPEISSNGISGNWNPAINNLVTTTYTFIANSGQCVNSANMTINILNDCQQICENQNIVVSTSGFTSGGNYSQIYILVNENDTIINSNFSGTFLNPSIGTYYVYALNTNDDTLKNRIINTPKWTDLFVESNNYCSDVIGPKIFTIIQNVIPIFDTVLPYCQNATILPLPTISNNLITGTWSPIINNTITSTYTFVPSSGVCANSITKTIEILPITNSTTDLSICQNQLPYVWNGLIFNGAGSQTATLTAVDGCDSLATLNLSVVEDFNAQWIAPSSICENTNSIDLNNLLLPESSLGGLWSGTNVSGQYFTPSGLNGSYSITYQVGTGECAKSETHIVEVLALGNASWTPPAKICGSIDPVNLNQFVTGDFGGTWEGNGVQGSMWFTQPLEGSWEVSYTVGSENCQSTQAHTIEILSQEIKFHNAFSPNGDGINDFWTVKNIENHPDNQLIIINRWGNEVYRKEGYLNDWDGSSLNEGTYFYFMDVNVCDNKKKFSGYITLVR